VGFRPRIPYSTVLTRLGLTTNLKLVLDAGDIASAASSTPDKWLDVSGNGYDFFRGTGTGADAADPTFNGTPGSLSTGEYWSSDGGDNFTYDTTNETWMQNLHKDNAKFAVACWIYPINPGGANNNVIFGNNGGSGGINIGSHFVITSANLLQLRISNGPTTCLSAGTQTVTPAQWNFVGMSIDESIGANGFMTYLNGASALHTSTYTSPSAASATFTTQIGDRGNSNSPLPNTARMAFVAIWEGVTLTAAQFDGIYNATHSSMPQYKPTRFFTRKF
jgi:hypothetical protein